MKKQKLNGLRGKLENGGNVDANVPDSSDCECKQLDYKC